MRHAVHLHEPLGRDLRVHLRGRDGGVPEQFLHHTNIGSALQQVRCETVAHGVRREVGAEPGGFGGFFEDEPGALASESAASSVDEERGGAFTVSYEGGAGTHQVVLDCFLGVATNGYESLFVSLTEESNVAGQSDLVAVFVGEGSLEVHVSISTLSISLTRAPVA